MLWMGKLTISMAIFNSYVTNYQRVFVLSFGHWDFLDLFGSFGIFGLFWIFLDLFGSLGNSGSFWIFFWIFLVHLMPVTVSVTVVCCSDSPCPHATAHCQLHVNPWRLVTIHAGSKPWMIMDVPLAPSDGAGRSLLLHLGDLYSICRLIYIYM